MPIWSDVTKLDQENTPSGSMFGDLQQIDEANEAGLTSQI